MQHYYDTKVNIYFKHKMEFPTSIYERLSDAAYLSMDVAVESDIH